MEIKFPIIHKMEEVEFEKFKSLKHKYSWQTEFIFVLLQVPYK